MRAPSATPKRSWIPSLKPLFDPEELHAIARAALRKGEIAAILDEVTAELARRYPRHIETRNPWIFNNAGGAMGQLKLLHGSLSEYVLLFGTPIGTEGHSGRYATEVHDFMLDGEMWCYHAGEVQRAVYGPGDAAYLGRDRAKGYRVPDRAWMLEYARGPIPTMMPFGLSDAMLSAMDRETVFSTLRQYGRQVTRNLVRGKI